MLKTSDLWYELPQSAIARHPVEPRDTARLMVVDRAGGPARHLHVRDLADILRPGDLLVVNSTRVLPARLTGHREDTGGRVEGLWLAEDDNSQLTAHNSQHTTHSAHQDRDQSANRAATDDCGGGLVWRVMLKGRRMKPGVRVPLTLPDGAASGMALVLIERSGEAGEEGAWVVRVAGAGDAGTAEILERVGMTPLPPYIRAARKAAGEADSVDVERLDRDEYQTVYADARAAGSVAAPTAGLHFTPELLARLAERGVRRAEVVLHVGTGTFKPVETEFVEQHPMHAEWCVMPSEVCREVVECRRRGGRLVAVGTTSARTLESFTRDEIEVAAAEGRALEKWTRLLITPGYTWKNVDALMTNFHLPGSTLVALVAGFAGSVDRVKSLYAEAMVAGYRFYSYGDAMVVSSGL